MISVAASEILGVSHSTIGLLPPISSATILPGLRASLPVDGDAGLRRAGEQHAVDALVGDQRLAFFGPADQHLDHRRADARRG